GPGGPLLAGPPQAVAGPARPHRRRARTDGAAMSVDLRAGLIGLGHMGRHHARVLRTLPDVELVAAVDARADARQRGAATGLEVLESVSELVRRGIDLCVVSTPTGTHEEIALELAEAGVATLIEKPVAHSSKSAQTILEAFERYGVVGCVG